MCRGLVCSCDCGISLSYSLTFYNHLADEERAGCFILIVVLLSCSCSCYVSLPYGAMGWSLVCHCCKFVFYGQIKLTIFLTLIWFTVYAESGSVCLYAESHSVSLCREL